MKAKEINRKLDWFMGIIAIIALTSLILKYGVAIPGYLLNALYYVDILIIASFILNSVIRLLVSPQKGEYIISHKIQYILTFLFIFQIITFALFFSTPEYREILEKINLLSITKVYIILFQGYILFELLIQLGGIQSRISKFPLPPSVLLVSSFVAVILIGSLLLMLPKATVAGRMKFIDALFTATSATCVTGLIVVDTGTYFTHFGKTVILILIQLGGLGLMTFATFFALIIRGQLGLRERMLLGDVLNFQVFSKIKNLIKSIIAATFVIELVGVVLIYLIFHNHPPAGDGSLFSALFHSISAFCNAGFSLFATSFEEYKGGISMNLVITTLIIIGGFGFVVIADIWKYIKSPIKDKIRKIPHFSLQTKVVVSTSFVLIIIGAVVLLLIEENNFFRDLPFGTRLLSAYFQSVTARTAGFNTVNISKMHIASLWILIVLMFIGASPGSTGGGIKTTTFASLFALLKARMKGRRDINLFNREIPPDVINGAILVSVLAVFVVFMGTLILTMTENATFEVILFEVMSAFGTVGLSCGITPQLTVVGKLVITIIMLVGRIGPLTLIFAIPGKPEERKFRYTEERVMIG